MARQTRRRVSFSDDPIELEVIRNALAEEEAEREGVFEDLSAESHTSADDSIDSGKGSSDQGMAHDIQKGAELIAKYEHAVDVDDRLQMIMGDKSPRYAPADKIGWAKSCRRRLMVGLRKMRSCVSISDSTAEILEIILIYGGILLTIALFSFPVVIHFVGPAAEVITC